MTQWNVRRHEEQEDVKPCERLRAARGHDRFARLLGVFMSQDSPRHHVRSILNGVDNHLPTMLMSQPRCCDRSLVWLLATLQYEQLHAQMRSASNLQLHLTNACGFFSNPSLLVSFVSSTRAICFLLLHLRPTVWIER